MRPVAYRGMGIDPNSQATGVGRDRDGKSDDESMPRAHGSPTVEKHF